jgi:anti-anti-sigma factor
VLDTPVVTTPPFVISPREEQPGVLRVHLTGDFDMSVGDALASTLTDASRRSGITDVIVDLKHTRFIDSHAVAGLVAGYEAMTLAGGRFSVVNGRGMVQQVLDITGLSDVLCA